MSSLKKQRRPDFVADFEAMSAALMMFARRHGEIPFLFATVHEKELRTVTNCEDESHEILVRALASGDWEGSKIVTVPEAGDA